MGMASSGKDGAEAVFSWMQDQYDRIYEMWLGCRSIHLCFIRMGGQVLQVPKRCSGEVKAEVGLSMVA